MIQADAVIDVRREQLLSHRGMIHRLTGTGVRAVDAQGRYELGLRWFSDRILRVSNWAIGWLSLSILLSGFGIPLVSTSSNQWVDRGERAMVLVLLAIVPLGTAFLLRWLRWPQLVRPLTCALIAHQLAPFCPWIGIVLYMLWLNAWSSALMLVVTVFIASWLNLITLFFSLLISRVAWNAERAYWALAPKKERFTPPPVMLVSLIAWIVSVAYALGILLLVPLGILNASGSLEMK
jgi:hypothetical protein